MLVAGRRYAPADPIRFTSCIQGFVRGAQQMSVPFAIPDPHCATSLGGRGYRQEKRTPDR